MALDDLSFDEVLKHTGLSGEQLERLVSSGDLRAFRHGDELRFKLSDVDGLLVDTVPEGLTSEEPSGKAVSASRKKSTRSKDGLRRKKKQKQQDKTEPQGSDAMPLHFDSPAEHDQLGRKVYAESLAKHVRRIFPHEKNKPNGTAGSPPKTAFCLHIHGPWGAGKSSLLNLLRAELQQEEAGQGSQWIVVEFNAWQHEHLDPPWWSLLDAVFRQSAEQLGRMGPKGWALKKLRFSLGEYGRRLMLKRAHIVVTVVLVFLAAALVLVSEQQAGGRAPEVWKWVGTAGKIIVPVASLWGAFLTFSGSLLPGSVRAAKAFSEQSSDPMQAASRHFEKLVQSTGRQVAVFIDDVDRCRPAYVVSLLEGIQTLFKETPVLYAIAGDRKWISTCYEKSYADFTETVRQPGQRLGYLFVEKAFQLSVRVPRLSAEGQGGFWDHLLIGGERSAPLAEARVAAEALFRGMESEDDIVKAIEAATQQEKIPAALIREEAVRRLSERAVQSRTEHALQAFAPLLDRNPRSMKRMINFYSLLRAVTLSEGSRVARAQLVRWLILSMRWPLLAEHFEDWPEAVLSVTPPAGTPMEAPTSSGSLADVSEQLLPLFTNRAVAQVVHGETESESLSPQAIRQCTGRA